MLARSPASAPTPFSHSLGGFSRCDNLREVRLYLKYKIILAHSRPYVKWFFKIFRLKNKIQKTKIRVDFLFGIIYNIFANKSARWKTLGIAELPMRSRDTF